MTTDLNTHTHGAIGHISLNRPKALHALTQGMCEAMAEALLGWRGDDAVTAVLLDHAEGRGFCAGGDVQLVRTSALEDGGAAGRAFFHAEYRLNHLMFTYPKPIVAFMDGVTMGGGVGISQPCPYRVATENTLFAMPEGSIGLFPDVGASWYLPRLPGATGRFLALTAARLDGAECLWAGLATHYIRSEDLAEVKACLAVGDPVEETLERFSSPAPEARIAGNVERIDRLFGHDTLEGIIAALEADDSEWAAKELKAVRAKCPMTGKVALRQFTENASCEDFAANMAMEYRVASRMMLRPDFAEGVRALLIDKTGDPQWNPATPEEVMPEMVDAVFAPMPQGEEWTPFPA
ncbi:enoyl-CoA hydratase/isomerase family protein [Erythrobacter arachoides]|uniref:3-hydroxyisobutyryl-CoA hydrolase n=1 Tax=Aurantiacibacter arachoides TaxID=1850444 RepID=A0A845A268_9SPHN|nr:enoyl-CoA hydratase/isomerase family protein [Aurantiacibacter arachoides]MXO94028.1 enoyl-CoA hydratase/isomerase family protein [Aurantiacibacter arachoides]GGD44645.1 enoyl-CoA hydratase [Aurantiacibacter arachoides]